MKPTSILAVVTIAGLTSRGAQAAINNNITDVVEWDPYSLIIKGERVFIFSAEFHYQTPCPGVVEGLHRILTLCLDESNEMTLISNDVLFCRMYFKNSKPPASIASLSIFFGFIIPHTRDTMISTRGLRIYSVYSTTRKRSACTSSPGQARTATPRLMEVDWRCMDPTVVSVP